MGDVRKMPINFSARYIHSYEISEDDTVYIFNFFNLNGDFLHKKRVLLHNMVFYRVRINDCNITNKCQTYSCIMPNNYWLDNGARLVYIAEDGYMNLYKYKDNTLTICRYFKLEYFQGGYMTHELCITEEEMNRVKELAAAYILIKKLSVTNT